MADSIDVPDGNAHIAAPETRRSRRRGRRFVLARGLEYLERATKTAQDAHMVGQHLTSQAVSSFDPGQVAAKGRQAASNARQTLKQIRQAVEPKEVAGGLAGLTVGQAIGGAAGGVAGAAVGGPAGAIVGAEVGAFTAGMLGLKLGADAVNDYLESKKAAERAKTADLAEPQKDRGIGSFLQRKTGERLGEIVGLTSGATLGLVIAGPAGGLVGAVFGEALGGHVGEDVSKTRTAKTDATEPEPKEDAPQWLNRFGRNTAGEAAAVLVAGGVGSIFGPMGRQMGHHVGLIVGKRVEWHKLGDEASEQPNAAAEKITATTTVQLTSREVDVLILLAKDMSIEDIARQLGILPKTVKRYCRSIYRKMGVAGREEAVARTAALDIMNPS